ncbi:MAG TPA: cell division protein FtsA [Firmicutes bacterium]|nr:cell division protein FtsA [Bacillota bacterium]
MQNGAVHVRKIISGIDIGSDSIKFIVGEIFEGRLHVLSASKFRNSGIERGKVVDEDAAVDSIKKAIEDAREVLSVDIDKCILGLNMINARIAKSENSIKIENESHMITGQAISTLMTRAVDGKIPQDFVLAGVIPIEFVLDENKIVERPIGMKSENLKMRSLVVALPRDYVSVMLDLVNKSGLKVIDVVPNAVGDYYAFKNHSLDEQSGAIINLGNEATTISIFDKGELENTSMFPLGGKNIVKDISYLAKIGDREAYAVYKDIVLANSRLANPNEYRIVVDLNGEKIKINQFDISEVASSRIDEILNLVKKQINVLTKREISYIIVTGGLTELRDFKLSLERAFGKNANLGKLNVLGARDNSYSSAIGIIQFFEKKLDLKGKGYSIFNDSEIVNMTNSYNERDLDNNSLLSKVFGYFFDN